MLAEKSNKLQVNKTIVCLKFWKEEYCLTINFATWKCLLLIFKFFALINLLFSYEQLFSPQPTFLECNVIFLVPATVVALQMRVKIPFLCLIFYQWQLFFRQAKTALSEKVRLCLKTSPAAQRRHLHFYPTILLLSRRRA